MSADTYIHGVCWINRVRLWLAVWHCNTFSASSCFFVFLKLRLPARSIISWLTSDFLSPPLNIDVDPVCLFVCFSSPALKEKKNLLGSRRLRGDQSGETGTKGDVTEQSRAVDNKRAGPRRQTSAWSWLSPECSSSYQIFSKSCAHHLNSCHQS